MLDVGPRSYEHDVEELQTTTHLARQTAPTRESIAELIELYTMMVRIRTFELAVQKLFQSGELPGFVHLYAGEEAIAAGVCRALDHGDAITSTHRGHGHVIARGTDLSAMMAEILGKRAGLCHGKGGSMHVTDVARGVLGANGIVGAGIPIAAGAALAAQLRDEGRVAVCFFGDGAANQGVFMETLNLSAIWRLPLVLVCENNGYAEWMRTSEITGGQIFARAEAFGIPAVGLDGNDVVEVARAARWAVDHARSGHGATLLEAVTYRHYGHNEGEEVFSGNYRPKEEIARWLKRDPLTKAQERLELWGADPAIFEQIKRAESEQIEDAVRFARTSPEPSPDEALTDLFASVA
jgi:TPP-dependent pyruvate/acetoin dehydrogenase alpha subunit